MHKINVQQIVAGQESDSHVLRAFTTKADSVAQRAFELFEERGGTDGLAIKDWLQAEQQILGDATAERSEDGITYQLRLALPGFETDQIEVAASDCEIFVHASMSKSAGQGTDVTWTEPETTEVFRRFQLPMPVEAGKVTALLVNGTLKIVAPKIVAADVPAARGNSLGGSKTCDPKCKNGCASAAASRTALVALLS